MTVPRSPVRIALWAVAVLSALFTLLLLIVTLALPGWMAGRGMALASEALGRPVSIQQAHFQPWRLAVVLDGLRIAGTTPDAPPLLTLSRLDAALSLRSLLRGRAVVESLELVRPELRLARVADGRYDIDDLIQRFAAKPAAPEGEDTEFAVYNIELTDGRVLFDDRPVQRQHELTALRLALPFVSTIGADVAVKVRPQLSGQLDGVAFDSRAEALPFADDVSARLAFKLAGLDLAPLAAYLPAELPLRLRSGRLDVDLALDFAERPRQPPGVKLSGGVQLHQLALTRPDGQSLLDLKHLSLPLVDVQPLRRQLGFGQILLDTPVAALAPLPAAKGAGGTSQPWQFSLAGLEIRDGRFTAREVEVDALQLKLGAVAWPLKQPVQLDTSLRVARGTLSAQARLAADTLQADARLDGLAMEELAPWLPLPAGARLAGVISGKTALNIARPLDDDAADRARLALQELKVSGARLNLAGKPLLTLAGLQLDQADIDPAARLLKLGTLKLDAPRAQLARDATGQLNIAALQPAELAASAPAASPAWKLQLAGLSIERGGLRWRDAAVPAGMAPVALAVEPLRLQLGAMSWPGAAPVPAQLAVTLAALGANDQPVAASGGTLQWNGSVGLAPMAATGSLQTQGLPLHLLNAYLDPAWGLHLQRAELGMKADVAATQQADGRWQVGAGGDVRMSPLALLQTRVMEGQRVIGEDLLSWQSLQMDGVKLAVTPDAPLRVAVREAHLDDVYARLIVNEQGRFNLRDIGPAEAASAPAPASSASAPPAEFAVERIRVNRGMVDFSDRFVRPNYSARLTELHGLLGAFSSTSTQMAPLTLRGKVAGTGLLEIDGQLKPGSPVAMEVQANASDIELAPLSTYAGKYAGYSIERGKLSARLKYKVEPGGQLVASNQIILNQLTFGERVESPEATSLPVRFAVSLLKDRDGVIDVHLPVSGSLSDPEFSVGGLVWKLFLNLIGKAVTSPFSLFSGNDAPEAAQVAFTAGSAELAATDRLERIAKLLADKPGVQLTLTGWADPVMETVALRELRLAAALKAENAPTPEAALKRLYQASKLPNKPRNVLGLAKDLPPEQMRGLLMGSYAVDDETLRQLAVARAVAVRDALLARGAPNARLFLATPKLCDGACESGWQPHVEMSLAAN
ncbi:DUF748 domain-containing protein [Roseateles asaccharophilus]|uniref:Uncharacterized protein involved in outer membrane biogenesis n=1 Tax=Roseateles asaccharophilus TaxID=582607 RepID=A0ABU2A5W1_9BURK|nr:DUF748 domain-containing protein [Roseateles asaccharophilus]MDR7332536.1 uncharacterized protein involved in outer membrane biogenesis [Roseateles asaccharophilus]